jgi:hypothetical protein
VTVGFLSKKMARPIVFAFCRTADSVRFIAPKPFLFLGEARGDGCPPLAAKADKRARR